MRAEVARFAGVYCSSDMLARQGTRHKGYELVDSADALAVRKQIVDLKFCCFF